MTLNNKEYVRNETIRMFLLGYPQEKIASELNISEGYVSNIVNEAMNSDDTFPLQRNIAIVLRKTGIDIKQLSANLRWENKIKVVSLDEVKIEKFLESIEFLFKTNGIDPETTASCVYSIATTMLKSGIPIDRVEEETKSKYGELRKVNENINQKKQLLEKSKIKIEGMMAKNNVKEELINLVIRLGEIFGMYDLDEIEIFNLARIIKNFKELNWDVTSIKSEYQNHVSLKAANEDLEKKIDKKEIMLEQYRRMEKEQENRLNADYNAFRIFSNLIQAGLKREDIFNISFILKNDFSNNSISQLIEDIRTYGSLALAKFKLEREFNTKIES